MLGQMGKQKKIHMHVCKLIKKKGQIKGGKNFFLK